MADWQWVYLVTNLVVVGILVRIGIEAFQTFWRNRHEPEYQQGGLVLWFFIAFVVAYLSKDAFWAIVLFWRDRLPAFLDDNLRLSIVLAVISIGSALWINWLWGRTKQ